MSSRKSIINTIILSGIEFASNTSHPGEIELKIIKISSISPKLTHIALLDLEISSIDLEYPLTTLKRAAST